MKLDKIIYSLIAFSGIFFAGGCVDETDIPGSGDSVRDGYINVTLRSSRLTRATEDGIDTFNENLIESAVLLLYPDDGTAGSEETYAPTLSQKFDGLDAKSSATLHVVLSESVKKRLFGNDGTKKCRAYVFANLPEDVTGAITSSTTVSEIKRMTVTSPFEMSSAPASFVMDGTGEVSLASDGKSADGNVELQRAASKITLSIRVPQEISVGEGDDATVWYSRRDNMTAAVMNGVKVSAVVPSNHENTDSDYYSMPIQQGQQSGPRSLVLKEGASQNDDSGFPYVVNVPFYTYPNTWEESAGETHRTFITLMVPWREGTDGSFRTSYYQVPINRETSIARNVAYNVNLNVGVLGSFVPDEPFELTDCSYTAVNWSEERIDVNISDYRYLVVDTEYYVINNEPSISIPVYTSHPSRVSNVTATYYRYNVTSQGNETPVKITQAVNDATGAFTGGPSGTGWNPTQIPSNNGRTIWQCELGDRQNQNNVTLELTHDMIQWEPRSTETGWGTTYYPAISQSQLPTSTIGLFTPTDNAEYSRYEFEITIEHTDNPNYSQTIKVVQYPAMYIEAIQNNPVEGSSAAQGNMYVNRNQQSGGNNNWIRAAGLTGRNVNPNQYILTTTVLTSNDYILGDPRSKDYTNLGISGETTSINANNLNSNWFRTNDMDGASRILSYYYPTDDDSSMKNYLAPKLRIASSYGVSYQMSYTDAQRRCAGYQEMMAPAGRWRIPTVAEIEYMIYLSNEGYIPALFSSGYIYWSAQGGVTATLSADGKLPDPSGFSGNNYVRCVYDEWYWEGDTIPGTGSGLPYQKSYSFTWGDREIDFSTTQTRSSDGKGGAKTAASLIDRIRNN